ncbi:MAG: 30S ribosomal protein S21 [Candidatus Portnoybacteria bacterium CG10_big_fil_rev_8_21_14_0_10_36_7]|uniref:Small ribosomal subunit protein bS21 n=1 Tax=Candidatus Portnoybacteria bacterium CG10_big_fil_rev_8_21_14_0_10_36_7 TaxID=1974812 RepID=A0A2M8KE77_9BACT|nr:MAG: 30S ribosomal protein S21 [Candidatus Portnoybacteria bacterium CG10_big_fil_rev_8_21_14_0_10_36_7]
MAIEVKRKERETTGSLLRRFSQRMKQSGVLHKARKGRFYIKPKTKRQERLGAKRRQQLIGLREELVKSGQLQEGELIPKDKIKAYELKSSKSN